MMNLWNDYMRGMLPYVRDFLTETGSPLFRDFQLHSKGYNAMGKFGHHGCREDFITGGGPTIGILNGELCFTLSDIIPSNRDRLPRFGNLMCFDTETALQKLHADPRNQNILADLDQSCLRTLLDQIRELNPLAQVYRTAYDRLEEYRSTHEGELPRYRVMFSTTPRGTVLDENGQPIRHADDIPMPGGLDVVIWHDPTGDSTAPVVHGVWLYGRGNFVELPAWDPLTWPASFPIVFGRGQLGFRSGLRTNPGGCARQARRTRPNLLEDEIQPENMEDDPDELIIEDSMLDEPVGPGRPVRGVFISMREFIIYLLWRRPFTDNVGNDHGTSFLQSKHFILDLGKLTQTVTTILGLQVKARQAEGHIRHQEQEMRNRTALSTEYVQFLERAIDRQHPGAKLGRFLYVPKEIPGSRRYYQTKYTDLLSLKTEMGRNPDFFLTVTMDIHHPRVKEMIPPGVDPLDRPDVLCRVWEEIWHKIIDDVAKKGRLGKCLASAIVREHQGRGPPHAHMLIWVEDCPGKGTPDWVNDYICAEFLDPPPPEATGEAANEQRCLCKLQADLMVHHHTADSPCMVNGRCKRFFPKEYSEATILQEYRFPVYRRRHPLPAAFTAPPTEETIIGEDTEPVIYRRRPPVPHDRITVMTAEERAIYGNTIIKRIGRSMKEFDNRFVVPTNLHMLGEYQCHVCLEFVGSSNVFHYLCDYCCKGAPLIAVRVQNENRPAPADATPGEQPAPQQLVDYNEFEYDARATYYTATHMLADLINCPLFVFPGGFNFVELYVTMPGRERVIFPENDPENAHLIRNTLRAYYELNTRLQADGDHSADHLTYQTFLKEFRFVRGVYQRRRWPCPSLITRLGRVAEHDTEAQSYRTLLYHVPKPTSPNYLRRYPGDPDDISDEVLEQRTFTEAARRRGLLASPEIWIQTIRDAYMEIRRERDRCRFFAILLYNGHPPDIRLILDTLLDEMIVPPADTVPADSREERRQRALNAVEYYLATNYNSSCEDVGLDAPAHYEHRAQEALELRHEDQLFATTEDGAYTGDPHRPVHVANYWQPVLNRNLARMTEAQRNVFDNVMRSIRTVRDDPYNTEVRRCFMLEGPGGVGKTLINETIIAQCMVEGLSILPTASTGIAANLLPLGATLHSTLKIPRDVRPATLPQIESQTNIAGRLRRAQCLIIDEVSMLHVDAFTYVDRQLRDLWPNDSPRASMPFGGIVILLTGNWAQLKPVVRRGNSAAQRDASIKVSELFRQNFEEFRLRTNMRVLEGQEAFAAWLDKVGRGQNYVDLETRYVQIPEQCRIDSLQHLIDFVFPPALLNSPIENVDQLRSGAILAPYRETVSRLNQMINDVLPGPYVTKEGYDHLVRGGNRPSPWAINRADADVENLHHRQPSGFPPYRQRFKIGSVCIIVCNYDPKAGLFNGTRVQILGFVGDNLIRVRILDERSRFFGRESLLGRCRFEYGREEGDRDIPFTREQFPLDYGFALTGHRSQGQTLILCGVCLWESQCFADNMFYTMCSRTVSFENLRILSSRDVFVENPVDSLLIGEPPRVEATQEPPQPDEPAVEPMDIDPAPASNEQIEGGGEPMDTDPAPVDGNREQRRGDNDGNGANGDGDKRRSRG
jgi:hypothetical protein